jgi:mRNA interferase HicA
MVALRTFLTDNGLMTGNEFVRKVKALARRRGVTVTLNASRGKGSHRTLYYGSAFTVIRDLKDELKTGTFHAMCSQLGITSNDL